MKSYKELEGQQVWVMRPATLAEQKMCGAIGASQDKTGAIRLEYEDGTDEVVQPPPDVEIQELGKDSFLNIVSYVQSFRTSNE